MKNTLASLLFVASISLHAQSTFPDLGITTTNAVAPGYFLVAPNARDSVGLMDHSGKSLFPMKTGTVTNLQAYGNRYLTYYSSVWQAASGCFVRRDKNFAIIDSLFLQGNYVVDFHEGRVWSDTSYVILGVERKTIDMSQLHPGGRVDATVLGAVIQERTFSGQLVFEWKSLDHIPVTEAVDDIDLGSALIDYIHVNSISYTSDGHYLVSCRHLDEIIKIHRTTGDVIWRLGGSKSKNSSFTIFNDTQNNFTGFSHQHSAVETPRGTILLFDNGNLKPEPKTSRAVEYEINLDSYIATKVWEHYAPSGRHSTAMGSVEELVNGNVLINYGATEGESRKGVIIAEEVARNGRVAASISNTNETEVTSYRVMKTTFGMAGCYNYFTTPDTVTAGCNDSTTYVTLEISSITNPSSIVVERHNYQPHNTTFLAESYCGVLPLRWVVKLQDSTSMKGAVVFNVSEMDAIEQADRVKLLYRPTEGQGPFAVVDAAYNAQQQCFRIGKLLTGEFMVAYRECLEPLPSSPPQAATEVNQATTIVWQAAAINDGYEVDVSTTNSFTTYNRLVTRRTDTTLSNLKLASTYFWRVRRIHSGFVKGPWSPVFRFTTQLGVPTPRSPITKADTTAVTVTPTLRWDRAEGGDAYRVVIIDRELEQPIVNEITAADSFVVRKPLMNNTAYYWSVSSVRGAINGRSSARQFIITEVAKPRLVSPANDTLLPHVPAQYFTWEPVSGAIRYAVRLSNQQTKAVVKVDTVLGLWCVLSDVPEKTDLSWTVRAIGRYGPGGISNENHFGTYSSAPLTNPLPLSPKDIDNVATTTPVGFAWSNVPDATAYRLQITPSIDFRQPLVDTVVTTMAYNAQALSAGTTYSWRVMAKNDFVSSKWSDTARFITSPGLGKALVPLWPRISSADVPTRGVVRYSTSDQFARYDVQFSRSPLFSAVDVTFASTESSVEYSQLRERTEYFWRVQGVRKSDGEVVTGPMSSFTTAYETLSADNHFAEVGLFVTPVANGLQIQSAASHVVHYTVTTLLGQSISEGAIEPQSSLYVPVGGSGPVFVSISVGNHAVHTTIVAIAR